MRKEQLRFLACPKCQSSLLLREDEVAGDEICFGTLDCSAGCGSYPIERGVARLLPELATQESHQISSIESQKETAGSFGAQWDMYEYGETTWGVTVEERIHVVLHELAWGSDDLPGKVILDAGCGNGTLSCELAERGATVVALDLSESVFRAQENCSSPNTLFVQGNLFCPPFPDHIFDAIYSCGVFHHTPDTRRCFDELAPTLKNDSEARYFVWLYAKRSWFFNLTVENLMKITRHLPSQVLVSVCRLLAPIVEGYMRVAAAVGSPMDAPRTLRDRTIQLHDLLAPAFVWYHTYDEARQWAEEAGFQRMEETVYSGCSECPKPVQNILDKYLLICRPGFGMLTRYGPSQ